MIDEEVLLSTPPPANPEAERAILGAMIFDQRAIEQVAGVLRPDHFHDSRHQMVCRAIYELFAGNQAIDLITLKAALKRVGHLEAIGGDAYLASCAECLPTATHVLSYASLVYACYQRRQLINRGLEIVRDARDMTLDADQCVEKATSAIFRVAEDRVNDDALHISECAKAGLQMAADARERGGIAGIPCHIEAIDEIVGGFKNGNYIVIGGRPSMGKTALALTLAANFTAANPSVKNPNPARGLIFSLEQSKEELSLRLLSMVARVPYTALLHGRASDEERQRVANGYRQHLAKANLYVVDDSSPGIFSMLAKCRRVKRMYGLDFVIIDYLQLMSAPELIGKSSNRTEEITAISRHLKLLARELEVPVIVLSQLNRAVESRDGRRPVMSDLRESGAIEQDADVVMFLHREEYYHSMMKPNTAVPDKILNRADVIVAKNRTGGPTGTAGLTFVKELMMFTDYRPGRSVT